MMIVVQGSSLLWTPALRLLYNFNVPAQELVGVCGVCVRCVVGGRNSRCEQLVRYF